MIIFLEKIKMKSSYAMKSGYAIGEYGNLEIDDTFYGVDDVFYYEFDIQKLIQSKKINRKYQEVAKYPPQVEDLTLLVPEKTYIGDVISSIKSVNQLITKVELTDIYQNSFTFNLEYQDKNKTLKDQEVEAIRTKILSMLKTKFGISIKE